MGTQSYHGARVHLDVADFGALSTILRHEGHDAVGLRQCALALGQREGRTSNGETIAVRVPSDWFANLLAKASELDALTGSPSECDYEHVEAARALCRLDAIEAVPIEAVDAPILSYLGHRFALDVGALSVAISWYSAGRALTLATHGIAGGGVLDIATGPYVRHDIAEAALPTLARAAMGNLGDEAKTMAAARATGHAFADDKGETVAVRIAVPAKHERRRRALLSAASTWPDLLDVDVHLDAVDYGAFTRAVSIAAQQASSSRAGRPDTATFA